MKRGKKILLVDDEADFAEMIRMRLEANGFEILTAQDGKAGIEKAGAEAPDLILLDVMMPGMDGFETLRLLKRNTATRTIPVIMLTAKGETKSIFKADELGAADYLIKPIDSDDLLRLVRRNI